MQRPLLAPEFTMLLTSIATLGQTSALPLTSGSVQHRQHGSARPARRVARAARRSDSDRRADTDPGIASGATSRSRSRSPGRRRMPSARRWRRRRRLSRPHHQRRRCHRHQHAGDPDAGHRRSRAGQGARIPRHAVSPHRVLVRRHDAVPRVPAGAAADAPRGRRARAQRNEHQGHRQRGQVTWIPNSRRRRRRRCCMWCRRSAGRARSTSDGTLSSWRRGGGLRVYLDRAWNASGYGEMLGVVLPPAAFADDPETRPAARRTRTT